MVDVFFWDTVYMYTVSQKKHDTKLLPITSPNIIRFSKHFISGLGSKFATNSCFHHSLNMMLHYLVKYECQKMASL